MKYPYRGGLEEVEKALAGRVEDALKRGTAICPVCVFDGHGETAARFAATKEDIAMSGGVMHCRHHLRRSEYLSTPEEEGTYLVKNLTLPAFFGASDAELARTTGIRESSIPSHEFVRAGRCAKRALLEGFVLAVRDEGTAPEIASEVGVSESTVRRILANGLSARAREGIGALRAMAEGDEPLGEDMEAVFAALAEYSAATNGRAAV
jgi:hypothetical protein